MHMILFKMYSDVTTGHPGYYQCLAFRPYANLVILWRMRCHAMLTKYIA